MIEPNQGRVSRAAHRRSGRRSRVGASLLAALTAVATLAPAVARAQERARPALTEDQKAKTKEHFDKANRLYDVGKYQEAIAEYEAAYLISADPVALYNIAQCHRLNDQPEEAVRFYKNYLRNAPNASEKLRAEVEKKISEMEKRAEEKRRGASSTTPPVVTSPPPVAPTPPPVNPTPTPPPVNPPPTPTGPATTPTPDGPTAVDVSTSGSTGEKPSRVLPWSLMIGGGVLLATSIVLGSVAAAKAKDVEDLAAQKNVVFTGDAAKLEKDGKALSGAAVLTGLVGIAAGVTGVVLYLRSGSSAPEAAPPQATLYPVAGPGLAGAGARFTF